MSIILASQFNRTVSNPFLMDNANLGESSDIERSADTIVCLWNDRFKFSEKELSKEERQKLELLRARGFGNNKIYAKITKMRGGGGVGYSALLNFEPNSGKIYGEQQKQQSAKEEDKAF